MIDSKSKKKDGFYYCADYGWNRENLKIPHPVYAHLNHFLNNNFTIEIFRLEKAINVTQDEQVKANLECVLNKILEDVKYLKDLCEFVQDA